ncbi:MAG: type I glyceraldehyde-3-phosphate dehydrogenase [Patescibacteria group bacterium]
MNEKKTIRVAINGLGRIGRAFLKLAYKKSEIEIVAINDLSDINNLAYLIKYDSAYGRAQISAEAKTGSLIIDGRSIVYLSEKDPEKLPWQSLGIDVVVESTGFFSSPEKAAVHLKAGAKRVVVSAPFEGHHENGDGKKDTILMGINESDLEGCLISSNASCTTNAVSPVMQILEEKIGIEKAILSTVHAYTSSQRLVDSPDEKDWRRGRAGSVNIIPSTTGAAVAVTKAIPALDQKFDGIALRVPIITGSLADITFITKRNTTKEEINDILEKASIETRWQNILKITHDQIVSSDIIGDTHAAIVDVAFTKVVGGNLCKVLSWYDNEMGYTSTLVDHVILAGRLTQKI